MARRYLSVSKYTEYNLHITCTCFGVSFGVTGCSISLHGGVALALTGECTTRKGDGANDRCMGDVGPGKFGLKKDGINI